MPGAGPRSLLLAGTLSLPLSVLSLCALTLSSVLSRGRIELALLALYSKVWSLMLTEASQQGRLPGGINQASVWNFINALTLGTN